MSGAILDARVVFDPSASVRDMLARMDREGVASAWICAAPMTDMGMCREVNDALRDLASRSGGRIRWIASVVPLARGAEDEIRRCADLGAIGVGELCPSAHKWAIDDPFETSRFAATCGERGLFVLIRSERPSEGRRGLGRSGAAELASFARTNPVVAAAATGLGTGLYLDEVRGVMAQDLENIFYLADSASQKEIDLASSCAPDKVIWSSGSPSPTAPPIAGRAVCSENAERLLERAAMFARR